MTNREASQQNGRPCEWAPEHGRESYLDDEFHGVAHREVVAVGGRFDGEPITVCAVCERRMESPLPIFVWRAVEQVRARAAA